MKNATIITMTFATLLTTGLMAGNAAATPQECGARIQVTGVAAVGAFKRARERRATRRAKRAWVAVIEGQSGPSIFFDTAESVKTHSSFGLGSRFSDLDNAKNVIVNCKGAGRGKTRCTVTATPCTD